MIARFLQLAQQEIVEAVECYEKRAEGLGAEFYSELAKSMNDIEAHPELWGAVSDHYRRKLLSRFPFGIIYRVHEDDILIVAVAHTSRKPKYWMKRES